MANAEKICLGVITGPSGLQGDVKVKSFTADPSDIARYGKVSDKSGDRLFDIRISRKTAKHLVVQLKGVNDRNGAEALKGTELYVPREKLPQLQEEEFYYADLIGLTVEQEDGAKIGTVRMMDNFGAGDVLEVELEGAGTVHLPFTKAVVPTIDLAARRIVANPPPELMPGHKDDGQKDGIEG